MPRTFTSGKNHHASTGGSSLDVIGRILADVFANLWRHQILVLNQPGAGGTIAARAAASAQPDGYTLFMLCALRS
jgi:tripartite-type tricarboxylate transporter receptor subunit TctC